MEINPNLAHSSDVMSQFTQRPGEHLSHIRVKKGIDLAQVSKDLAIPLKSLQALEKDDYKVLPEATFIRGFIRAYAKYLQVDAQPLIQNFDRLYTEITGQATENSLTDSPLQVKGKLVQSKKMGFSKTVVLKPIGYLIGIVMLIGILVLIIQQVQRMNHNEDHQNKVEIINLTDKKEILNSTRQLQKTVNQSSADSLILNFKRPTSVYIEDAKGKILASGRQTNTLELSGQSPFKIRIDDATVATLSLNDENIDLSKRMVNGKVDFRLAP